MAAKSGAKLWHDDEAKRIRVKSFLRGLSVYRNSLSYML